MKRIAAIDFVRGLAIIAALLLFFYQVQSLLAPAVRQVSGFQPLPFYLDLFLTGGGVFLLLAGAALTVRTVERIHVHPHQLVFRWSLWSAVVGLLIAAVSVFLIGPLPLPPLGLSQASWAPPLLTSLLMGSGLPDPVRQLAVFLQPYPLVILAINTALLALALRWTQRSNFEQSFARNFVLFNLLGLALLTAGVVSGLPWLGLFGFSFLGAAVGLVISTSQHRDWAVWVQTGLGLAVTAVGLIGAILVSPYFLAGQVSASQGFLAIAVAGGLLVLTTLSLAWLDFVAGRRPGRRLRITRTIRVFGQLSLTVWLLMTPLTFVLVAFLNVLLPGWNSSLAGILLAGVLYVWLWGAGLKVWRMVRYRGSLEWLIQKLLRFIGKPSNRVD